MRGGDDAGKGPLRALEQITLTIHSVAGTGDHSQDDSNFK